MKLLGCLFAGIVSLLAAPSQGAQSARVTVYCYSLRLQQGLDPDGNYYLDVTSSPGGLKELAPDFFNSGYTHSAYLGLIDELLGETLPGQLALDVPDGGDLNDDGFPDFFQVSQGVTNLITSGAYGLELYGKGSTTATWNRAAGSKDGWCTLSLNLMPFQAVTFGLAFEILEYRGPLTYAPGTTNVCGILALTQTGIPENAMMGPVTFLKSLTNPRNELSLQAGTWTNELSRDLQYVRHAVTREETWPTNYYGYLEFDDDTNAATFFPFGVWMLSIDDPNDANHNGIPDFSDDPTAGARPRTPRLELTQSGTNVLLTLHADTGYLHEIQECSDLGSTNWLRVVSLTPTNDPKIVVIGLPGGSARFWRVRTE